MHRSAPPPVRTKGGARTLVLTFDVAGLLKPLTKFAQDPRVAIRSCRVEHPDYWHLQLRACRERSGRRPLPLSFRQNEADLPLRLSRYRTRRLGLHASILRPPSISDLHIVQPCRRWAFQTGRSKHGLVRYSSKPAGSVLTPVTCALSRTALASSWAELLELSRSCSIAVLRFLVGISEADGAPARADDDTPLGEPTGAVTVAGCLPDNTTTRVPTFTRL